MASVFSAKVMQWIVGILNMASKVQGEAIKRWRMNDHFADILFTEE